MRLSTAVRRVWQQFSRLNPNPSVYSAALVADVADVDCALSHQLNERTLLMLLFR